MTITPEEQAAIQNVAKHREGIDTIEIYSDRGVTTYDAAFDLLDADKQAVISIALRDYPDDDCKMTRQELIEELDAANETINNMGTELALLEDRLKSLDDDSEPID